MERFTDSFASKVDLRATATFFGTTYDTLENRFRKLKKDSATLQAEVGGGERAEVTPTRTKSTPSTPRKPKTPKKEPLASRSISYLHTHQNYMLTICSCCERESHKEDSEQEESSQGGAEEQRCLVQL